MARNPLKSQVAIVRSGATPLAMGGAGFLSLQGALGIESTTWGKKGWRDPALVFAVEAVFARLCDTALVVQTYANPACRAPPLAIRSEPGR